MGELVREVGVLGPRVRAEDDDGFVGVLAYGDGRVGVLEGGAVDARAEVEVEADSSFRFDDEPAEAAAAAARVLCLDGPMFAAQGQGRKRVVCAGLCFLCLCASK